MREAECPQSQVGRRVRHAAQTELDRVDRLLDHDLAKIELETNVMTYGTIKFSNFRREHDCIVRTGSLG